MAGYWFKFFMLQDLTPESLKLRAKELHMGHFELIRTLQTLPLDKQAEVVDFVEYLAARFATPLPQQRPDGDWDEVSFAEFSIAQAAMAAGSESVNYSLADLKERW